MTPTSGTIHVSQVADVLTHHGYDLGEQKQGLLQVREIQSGVTFQAALEGNVLYFTVPLMTLPSNQITPDLMRKMLSGTNGISTSSFRLYDAEGGKTLISLSNFCTLQDMESEDQNDILSLASYLMADVIEARDLLQPAAAQK
jgi:hypothetical protein